MLVYRRLNCSNPLFGKCSYQSVGREGPTNGALGRLRDFNLSGMKKPEFFAPKKTNLGGGFKHFLFSTLLGEMIQFD